MGPLSISKPDDYPSRKYKIWRTPHFDPIEVEGHISIEARGTLALYKDGHYVAGWSTWDSFCEVD